MNRSKPSVPSRGARFGALLLPIVLVLPACGGGGGGGGGGAPVSASRATITFPSPGSVTDAETIVIRGTTSGTEAVVGLMVNGVAAASTDSFATWQTTILLQPGANPLTVSLTDASGLERTDAAVMQVERVGVLPLSPTRLALEPNRDSYLVIERRENALLRMDRTTGVTQIVSNASRGSGTAFGQPISLAYDLGGDVIYVGDATQDAVFAVDPITGDRTTLIDRAAVSAQGFANMLRSPAELVFDDLNRRLLVADNDSRSIFAVQVATGTVSLISGGANAAASLRRGSGPDMAAAAGMGWDEGGNRLVVADYVADQVLAVNLTTGNRSVLSSNSMPSQPGGPDFHTATSLVMDASRRFAYVTDVEQPDTPNNVLEIDLDTGVRRVFSGVGVGSGPDLGFPLFCALDETKRRMLVGDSDLRAVIAIDLDTGVRSPLSDAAVGAGPRFEAPWGTVVDTVRNRLLVADRSRHALMAIDLASGDRSMVTQFDTDTTPYDVAIDERRDRALVTDVARDRVLAVDLDSGSFAALSIGSLSNKRHISVDPKRDLAIVTRSNTSNGSALWVHAIDLGNPDPNTGELPTTLLSRSTSPAAGSGPRMSSLVDLIVDPRTDVALVLEFTTGGQVLAIDLDSGDRTLIAGSARGTGPQLDDLHSIALHPSNPSEVLILDGSGVRLLSVDLNTGDRSTISRDDVGDGPRLRAGRDVAAVRGRALVFDEVIGLLSVDLRAGHRVISSSR